jgi:protein-L-isoaspartate(D-aspartate) O-methyltransferase
MIEHHHARGLGLASDASRKRLIDEVRRWGVKDERVLTALAAVPRHEFLEDAFKGRAYENNALPIGLSQTISQPYIVARMTEAALEGAKPHRCSRSAPARATRPRCSPRWCRRCARSSA